MVDWAGANRDPAFMGVRTKAALTGPWTMSSDKRTPRRSIDTVSSLTSTVVRRSWMFNPVLNERRDEPTTVWWCGALFTALYAGISNGEMRRDLYLNIWNFKLCEGRILLSDEPFALVALHFTYSRYCDCDDILNNKMSWNGISFRVLDLGEA